MFKNKDDCANEFQSSYIKYSIIVAVICVIIIGSWFVFFKKSNNNSINNQSDKKISLNEDEKNELLDKISKHIITFDMQDNPIIISVDNSDELKQQQAFFKDVKNGDVLLISKEKALIYRPDEDTLINVGPVYVNEK